VSRSRAWLSNASVTVKVSVPCTEAGKRTAERINKIDRYNLHPINGRNIDCRDAERVIMQASILRTLRIPCEPESKISLDAKMTSPYERRTAELRREEEKQLHS
jgi:hypothetical protein